MLHTACNRIHTSDNLYKKRKEKSSSSWAISGNEHQLEAAESRGIDVIKQSTEH